MPRILVMADEGDPRETVVLFQERVVPSELESDLAAARLIERLGWALVDAEEVEQEVEHAVPAAAASGQMRILQLGHPDAPPQARPLRAA